MKNRLYHIVNSMLPERARPIIRRVIDQLDGVARLAWRITRGVTLPPWSMRRRVGGATIRMYVEGGQRVAGDIERALSSVGVSLKPGLKVLDWGCGSGRTAAHFIKRGDVDLWGCDVDDKAISWLRRKTPNGNERFVVSEFAPPLPYSDGQFDVIYAVSLFTHFTESDQMAWLAELSRILSPDGVAVLTTAGTTAMAKTWWAQMGPGVLEQLQPVLGRLDEVGFAFATYTDIETDPEKFPGIEGTYGLTFQSEKWTRERWGEVFDVAGFIPGGIEDFQDIVLVRRPGSHA